MRFPWMNRLLGASLLVASACGSDPETSAGSSGATPAPSTAASIPAPPPTPTDPEGVPNVDVTPPPCTEAGGDARAMRQQLRTIARGREAAPPEIAPLLAGCALSRAEIAEAIVRAGDVYARSRDHAAASSFYRRAIEADPSAYAARLALAGARSELGQFDAALYQLQQLRQAGAPARRTFERAMRDRHLAKLRLRREFWGFAQAPSPVALNQLAQVPESVPEPLGVTLAFEPPLVDESDGAIYARARLASPNFRDVAAAVLDVTGVRLSGYGGLVEEQLVFPTNEELRATGLERLTHASIFRPTPTIEIVAVPLHGLLDEVEGVVAVVAMGPTGGPYRVLEVLRQRPECELSPMLLASRDRRVMGWSTSCAAPASIEGLGRCVLYANGELLAKRCGVGEGEPAVADEESYEDDGYEDYGD